MFLRTWWRQLTGAFRHLALRPTRYVLHTATGDHELAIASTEVREAEIVVHLRRVP